MVNIFMHLNNRLENLLYMSDISCDREKSFSISKSSTINKRQNSKDDYEKSRRKRPNLNTSNDHSNNQRT
ncbi:unnamed protein product [Rotaria sordida]|uniref:Uncharacterized protein n=1 Tax=Rotaria sordida TaxID=392033 RepID=A0A816E4T8_9BILA|nr:unnamed protein product [Rotaria sordida]CAF1645257.1 unnamed protein product [Rotaria sordida]